VEGVAVLTERDASGPEFTEFTEFTGFTGFTGFRGRGALAVQAAEPANPRGAVGVDARSWTGVPAGDGW
jgi:hypothetical protein